MGEGTFFFLGNTYLGGGGFGGKILIRISSITRISAYRDNATVEYFLLFSLSK